MKKIRMGIVGCGGICKIAHIPAYKHYSDRVEIVAVCDIIPQRAAEVSAELGGNPGCYTDYKKMFDEVEMDAVDICTPNYLHSKVAVSAFEHGINVFSEKPDAVSTSEAEKMIKASEAAGKLLMVMRNNRFLSTSKYLKEFVENGGAGKIYCGRCGWIRRRGIPGKGGWFTTKEQSGGGPLIDLGVHMIDLAIWLMGNPRPVSVTGATYCEFANSESKADSEHAQFGDSKADGIFDVEDLAMGFIKFDNGASLQIEFSWASNIDKEMNFVELRGTKAGFSWHSGETVIFTENESGEPADIKPDVQNEANGHDANICHFLDVLEKKAEPVFTPSQGLNMIKILSAIYESAQSGREVIL